MTVRSGYFDGRFDEAAFGNAIGKGRCGGSTGIAGKESRQRLCAACSLRACLKSPRACLGGVFSALTAL